MAEFPRLPIWAGDYLADTRHLTTTEHGAYWLLLLTAWLSDSNSLPNDDRLLRRYAGGPRNWQAIKPNVMAFWYLVGDKWRNKRLDVVRDWVALKSDKASHAAQAKWLKDKSVADANARGVAELVGNEGGVVSGVINLESSGVEASDWRPRHDEHYHEA